MQNATFLTETEEFFRDIFEDFDFFLAVVMDVRKADVEDAERLAFAGEVDADLAAGGNVAADVIGTLVVSGREQFSPFIRRLFSPKHEATIQQDRPSGRFFDRIASYVC